MKKSFHVSFFCIMLIACISTGCKPLSNLGGDTFPVEKMDEADFKKLDGFYRNYPDTVFGRIINKPTQDPGGSELSLADRLFVFRPGGASSDSTTVEIRFISENEAEINGFQKGSLVFTRKIKGGLKNGYFYLKPKFALVPFFPFLYYHSFERIRIGKSGNDIIVDHSIHMWAFALVFLAWGSDNGLTSSVYRNSK